MPIAEHFPIVTIWWLQKTEKVGFNRDENIYFFTFALSEFIINNCEYL